MAEDMKNLTENLAGNSPERDARARRAVVDGIGRIRTARQASGIENKWIVCDRLWRGEAMSRYWGEDMNQSHVPEPFKQERAVTPRLMGAVMPNDNWFRLEPERSGAIEPGSAKKMMQEQFSDGRLRFRLRTLVQQCAKYGFAVAKVPWVTDRREVVVSEAKTEGKFRDGKLYGTKTRRITKRQTVNRDRTELAPIAPADFFYDWRYDDIQLAPFCADESKVTREYVYAMVEAGVYAGITKADVMKLGIRQTGPETDQFKVSKENASGASNIQGQPEDEIKVADWWGLFSLEGDGLRTECNVVVLDDVHVVRICTNNFWHGKRPYVATPWTAIEGEGYGIGVIEPIVRLSMDIDDVQNAVVAGVSLSVNPMWKVGDDFNIIDDQIVARPGRVFRGSDVTQMQPMVVPDVSQNGYRLKEDLRREIDETNSAPRLLLGGEEGGSEATATAFTGRARQANIRLREAIEAFTYDVLQPLLDMALYNNQQFLDEARVVLYEGRAGQYFRFQVTPEDLAGISRVKAIQTPQIELLGVRGQMMVAFLGSLANLGPLAAQEPYRSAVKKAFINQFGEEDADDIFPDTNPTRSDTQEEELIVMLSTGNEIEVLETDDHEGHAAVCLEYMSTDDFANRPMEIRAAVLAHHANHDKFMQQAEQAAVRNAPDMEQMAGGVMEGEGVNAPNPDLMEGLQSGQVLAEDQRANIQGG